MDGSCAGHIVFVAFIEDRQIDVLIHQSVDGVLQCPRDKLVLERDGEHHHLIFIAWFVFCHGFLYCIEPCRLELVIKIPHLIRQFQRFAACPGAHLPSKGGCRGTGAGWAWMAPGRHRKNSKPENCSNSSDVTFEYKYLLKSSFIFFLIVLLIHRKEVYP